MDWVYSPQGRRSGESRMERGGRAFQPHFWYRVLLSHSLWSLSFSSLQIFFVFCFISPHTSTMTFTPAQADTLHYMSMITNRCRALNDSLGKKINMCKTHSSLICEIRPDVSWAVFLKEAESKQKTRKCKTVCANTITVMRSHFLLVVYKCRKCPVSNFRI